MEEINKMKLLILEDDNYQCNLFINGIDKRDDFELVATTNSVEDAINHIKLNDIEGVILDLELNNGLGESGLEFLDELNALQLDINPIVIVTTVIAHPMVHAVARDNGASWVFVKNKKDYSPEKVLNIFMRLRDFMPRRITTSEIHKTNLETQEQRKIRISKKINIELDNVGIPHHYQGRDYLFDAIYFLLEESTSNKKSYMDYLVKKHNRVRGTLSNSMQTAITKAWDKTPIKDLEKHFTANLTYENGSPTPTEFVCYYVNKIKELTK